MAIVQTLTQRLNHAWRVVATGVSFAVFGMGGVLITLLVMPALLLFCPQQQRRLCAQHIIHAAFRWFVSFMQTLGVMRLHVTGQEKLNRPQPLLVLANHPSLLDVVCLISIMPQADCIVKQALWRNPFTRGPVQAADYILNDQSDTLLQQCVERLSAGRKLLVFPEGTRTTLPELLNPFQRGAAHIALNSSAMILPAIIRCVPHTLSKNQAWYHIPKQRFDIYVDLQDAIDVATWRLETVAPSIQVRRLNAFLQDYFLRKLRHE